MGLHVDFTKNVCYELMYGYEAKAELDRKGIVYLPIGCLEMHGSHLPMGLDGIKAHGMCVLLAQHLGGVVFPIHHYAGVHKFEEEAWDFFAGKWGNVYTDHSAKNSLTDIINQIRRMGAKVCVLYTGHYPWAQLDMVREIEKEFNEKFSDFRVVNCFEADHCGGGDHAGIVETSLLLYLRRDMVNMAAIYDKGYKDHQWNEHSDPKLSSAEKGEQFASRILAHMESVLRHE